MALKNLLLLPVLAAFFAETLSTPTPFSDQYTDHALRKRQSLNVVATTNSHANIIDWIPLTSQGKIAKAPPLPPALPQDPTKKAGKPISELEMPGIQRGPAGTVPVPRLNATYLANVRQKQPPPFGKSGVSKRQNSGNHWYVTSNMNVNNIGGNWVMVGHFSRIRFLCYLIRKIKIDLCSNFRACSRPSSTTGRISRCCRQLLPISPLQDFKQLKQGGLM